MDLSNLGDIIHDNSFLRSQLSSFNNNLNFAHFNAQSFNIKPTSTKLAEIRSIVEGSLLDIVGVSETWLKGQNSNVVKISGYSSYRNDRPFRRGGGVALFISSRLTAKVVHSGLNYGVVECLFVEVVVGREKILVGVVYLPTGDFESLESELSDLLVRYSNIIIMGDFNNNLFDVAKSYNLRRACLRMGVSLVHNNVPTHYDAFHQSSSLIDYFLISCPERKRAGGQFISPGISKHAFIYLSLDFSVRQSSDIYEYFDYNNYDDQLLRNTISCVDFSNLYLTSDVDLQLRVLMAGIDTIHSAFPKRRAKFFNNSRDDWIKSPLVRYHQSLADIAYKAYLRDRNQENWSNYCRARNRAKAVKRRLKRNCHAAMFDRCGHPKEFWNIIRDNGIIGGEVSPIRTDNVSSVDDLNDGFVSNQLNVVGDFGSFLASSLGEAGFSFKCVTIDDVICAFSSVKSNASGNDGFPLKFYKIVIPHIADHFLHLVNTIIMTSKFPREWKTARVCPIKKKSSPNCHEYRPIALMPVLSKVFEYILKKQLNDYLEFNKLLSDCQCGFRSHRSTTMLLLGLTDAIRGSFTHDKVCVLLSLDLEKAFDRVDHFILVKKLHQYFSFGFSACKLIASYLTGRKQYVQINGERSNTLSVRSGVPQGSILGPMLFILFLNDLFANLDMFCSTFSYADDVQLLFRGDVNNLDVLQAKIDFVTNSLYSWMCLNNLSVNGSKTKALIFSSHPDIGLTLSYNGCDIEVVHHLKCLGVTIDDRLSFDLHIDNVISQTNLTLRQLYNSDLMLPFSFKKRLVHALAMPNILYGIEVFCGTNAGDSPQESISGTYSWAFSLNCSSGPVIAAADYNQLNYFAWGHEIGSGRCKHHVCCDSVRVAHILNIGYNISYARIHN
ncbi:uncharacterized protein LOC142235288 [Haematobia irritans]|uniref:uncharacterized protein LOC142235288 n=1 Tax=Haematobia irritans TaxID=7368 RepID=UPI003F5051C2